MNGSVVVDASFAVKWLVREVHSDKAVALARTWINAQVQPIAPHFMPVEIANALHRRVVRQELSLDNAMRLMERFARAGIGLRSTPGIYARAIELASELRQGASYDAHYLALAEFMGCDLWTADERFYRAAVRNHSGIHWIGEV